MKKNNKRNKRILYILISAIGLVILFITLFSFIEKMIKMKQSITSFSTKNEIYSKYESLFNGNPENIFTDPITYYNKIRNPISTCFYDSFYRIIIYKLDITSSLGLKNVIKLKRSNNIQTNKDVVFSGINGEYDFLLSDEKLKEMPRNIILTLDADSLKTIFYSDTLVNYETNFHSFSINYDNDIIKRIFVSTGNNSLPNNKIPISILFLKKQEGIYLLLMTELTNKRMPSKLLLNSIFGIR